MPRAFPFGALALALGAVPAGAQQPVPPQAEADSRIVYDRATLASYKASTAEDLVRRIPGASASLDSGTTGPTQRGFGNAGAQILINGRRLAGKANNAATTLRRISAATVERIELIRGTSAALDVASEGVVVNIVVTEGAAGNKGTVTAELNARFTDRDRFAFDGLLSYAGELAGIGVVASVERNVWAPPGNAPVRYSNRTRDERYFYPSGELLELRPQDWRRDLDKMIYTLALTRERGATAAHLNVFFQTLNFHDRTVTPFTRFALSGAPILRGTDVQTRDTETKRDFEIGGDWSGPIGSGKLKLLFLASGFNLPDINARERTIGTTTAQLNRSVIGQQQREYIVRGTYVFGGGAWEVGAEGALNRYRQLTELFLDFNGDGRLEPALLPEALARVQELRGEAFLTWNRSITPRLTLEATVAAEASRITSSYALYPPRSTFFIKPRLDLRWSPTSRDQIALKLEREVSQLEFGNFVPDYDPFNNRLNAGNPGIAPESKWRAQLRYEHRLPRDGGTIEARVFGQLTQGEIDLAVIGVDAGGAPITADANIGNARVWGAEGKFSFRLDPLGITGATLTGRYLRQWSRVVDPFRGEIRRVKGPNAYEFDLGFRHDLTEAGLSYGFDYRDVGDGIVFSDYASRDLYDIGPRLDLFVEKRLRSWLRLRVEAQQINGAREYRSRDIFAISQADGILLRRETYLEARDRRVTVKLRGEF